ncbi:hypothetical protein TrVE_jg5094 [Triparma verrucosa]|uniref:Uncharacterized protein n=1 Tax=Triparma verrucosa TaxID=1606542 RepID=A0A9W7B2C8_9STRA|nr:hypothetical protein TrVE_jg5094 [Triparma verrucosa]
MAELPPVPSPSPKQPQPAHRTGWSSSLKLPFKSKSAFSFLPSPRLKGSNSKGSKAKKVKSLKSKKTSPKSQAADADPVPLPSTTALARSSSGSEIEVEKAMQALKKNYNSSQKLVKSPKSKNKPPLIISPTPWDDRKLIITNTSETTKSAGTLDTSINPDASKYEFLTPTRIKPNILRGASGALTPNSGTQGVECVMGSPDLFLIHGPSVTPPNRHRAPLAQSRSSEGDSNQSKGKRKSRRKKVSVVQNFCVETESVEENLSDISNVSSPSAEVKIGKNFLIETEGDDDESFQASPSNLFDALCAPPSTTPPLDQTVNTSYHDLTVNTSYHDSPKFDDSQRSFPSPVKTPEPTSNANIVSDKPNKTLLAALSSLNLPPTAVVYYAPSPPPSYWSELRADLKSLPLETYTILITHHPHEPLSVPSTVGTSSLIKIVGEVDDRYERVLSTVKGFVKGNVEEGEATVRYQTLGSQDEV